jgi:hypothetical protein
MLSKLCTNAIWIHRETQEMAYVGFSDLEKAFTAYNSLNNMTFQWDNTEDVNSISNVSKFEQYNQDQLSSTNNQWSFNQYFESFDNSVGQCNNQITFKIHYAAPFLEVRYSNVFIPFTDIPKKRSCFLKVQSSYRVSLNQWVRIFNHAFDFYRSSDNSRVYVEFNSIEQAEEARKQVHMRLIPFVYKDCIRNVLVSAVFVSKKLAMKKTQLFLSNIKNQRLSHEEKLSNQIVDWLYNSSC